MFDAHGQVPAKRSPQESLRRIVRVLNEEAAAVADEHAEIALWLIRIADHLLGGIVVPEAPATPQPRPHAGR